MRCVVYADPWRGNGVRDARRLLLACRSTDEAGNFHRSIRRRAGTPGNGVNGVQRFPLTVRPVTQAGIEFHAHDSVCRRRVQHRTSRTRWRVPELGPADHLGLSRFSAARTTPPAEVSPVLRAPVRARRRGQRAGPDTRESLLARPIELCSARSCPCTRSSLLSHHHAFH